MRKGQIWRRGRERTRGNGSQHHRDSSEGGNSISFLNNIAWALGNVLVGVVFLCFLNHLGAGGPANILSTEDVNFFQPGASHRLRLRKQVDPTEHSIVDPTDRIESPVDENLSHDIPTEHPNDDSRIFSAYPLGGGGGNPPRSGDGKNIDEPGYPIYLVVGDDDDNTLSEDETHPTDLIVGTDGKHSRVNPTDHPNSGTSIDDASPPHNLHDSVMLYPDIIDPLNPGSIGIYDHIVQKRPDLLPARPNSESHRHYDQDSHDVLGTITIDSVDKRVELYDNDLIVNQFDESSIQREVVDFDVMRRGTDHDSIFRLESQIVGDEQVNFAEPDAKRQKVDSPTMSPTTQCNRDDYQRVRDPSAIAIRPSLPRAYSGNPAYTLLYQDASRDMVDIVNATDSDDRLTFVYNPQSPILPINVMTDVAHDITDWNNFETTDNTLVIYAFVEDDSNVVDYVGYSRNYTRRLDEHQVTRGSEYFESHTAVRLVDYDNIHHDTDAALSDRIIQFWRDVLDVPDLPQTLRRMYTNLSDQWHRGGPKKEKSGLMIETGTQLHYGVASPSEAFMYDEAKEHHLIDLATQAGEELVDIINTVWGPEVTIQPDEPFAISTWKTGASEGTLSSCIVTIEYVLGNDNWEDTTPEALFPNAETEAQIFAVPEENQAALGRFRFILIGYASNDGPAFVLVDAQNYMLTLIEVQMELCEMGYELVVSLLGGEIIVFRQNHVIVLLHGHPAKVCDSRDSIRIIDRQRRAVPMDALRIARQRAVGDTSDHRFDAIRGSIYAEISDEGWHGSKRFGAAICRDTMTKPDGVDAIAAFNGCKTPDDINYPTSDHARQRGRTREEWTVHRFTDQMSQTSIDNAVSMLNIHMERHEWITSNVQDKWRTVIDSYRGNPELQRRVRTSVRALPSGGDVAPQRASYDRGDRLEQSITTYRDQHNGSLDNFKVWFVRSGESFEAEQFARVEVHDMNTETNANTKLSGILGSFLKKRVSMQGLGVKFKKCNGAERIAFFQGTNLDHDTITNAELSIVLYKLVRK